jgi:preprotein translocase subunit SecG
MTFLIVLLRIVEVFVCLLLIGVILLQRTKGSGATIGGGMGESLFGAQMGNVLTKSTVVLGVIFLVNTLILSLLTRGPVRGTGDSLMDSETPVPLPPAPLAAPARPGDGAGPPEAPDSVPRATPAADTPATADADEQ